MIINIFRINTIKLVVHSKVIVLETLLFSFILYILAFRSIGIIVSQAFAFIKTIFLFIFQILLFLINKIVSLFFFYFFFLVNFFFTPFLFHGISFGFVLFLKLLDTLVFEILNRLGFCIAVHTLFHYLHTLASLY